jgi:hypothetical protein
MKVARARTVAWAALITLWAGQLPACLTSPAWLTPDLDRCLNSLLIVITVAVVTWTLAERYARPRAELEARLNAQDEAWAVWRTVTGCRPERHLRVANEKKDAI